MAGPPRPPFFLIPAPVDQNIFHIQPADHVSNKPKPSNRGRKPSKGPAPPRKKPIKRGMGIFKLEKLRMAEIYKTQINQQADQFNHLMSINNNNGGGMSGFENNTTSLGPFWINPYVFGAPDHMRVNGVGSNELSSSSSSSSSLMPRMIQQYYDQTPCVSCCSKKKKNKFISEMSPSISGLPDLQGLNLENNSFEFNDQMGLFGGRASRNAFYSNHNNINLSGKKGAEVVAVHRKINPKSGRNVMMEYEFFPDSKNGTFFKEETTDPFSCLSTSNSVDLSLKLSF